MNRSLTLVVMTTPHDGEPCVVANPAWASRLQSMRPMRRLAELGSLGQ